MPTEKGIRIGRQAWVYVYATGTSIRKCRQVLAYGNAHGYGQTYVPILGTSLSRLHVGLSDSVELISTSRTATCLHQAIL